MKLALLLAIVALSSCVSNQRTLMSEDKRAPTSESETYINPYLDDSPQYLPDPNDLTFAELETILEEKKFNRIDDLLVHLRKIKPDYFSHYALVFDSKSLHSASKENPRAIVYGRHGNFIITFNGDPKQKGYSLLEVTEFNHKTREFEYREIEFNEFGNLSEPYNISQVDGPPLGGQGKCLQCHSNRRPIWERYDVWPGTYGAYDDYPFNPNPKGGNITRFGLPHPSTVKEDWNKFVRQNQLQGRYSNLDLTKGPRNTHLSTYLTSLNTLRIAELLRKSGGSRIRHALIYAADCLPLMTEEYAKEIRPEPQIEKLVGPLRSQVEGKVKNYEVGRLSQLISDVGLTFLQLRSELERQGKVAAVLPNELTLMESFVYRNGLDGPAGYNIDDFLPIVALSEKYIPDSSPETWSMALFEGIHAYNGGDGFITFRTFRHQLREALFTPQEIADLIPIELSGHELSAPKINHCKTLAQKMKEELR